MMNQSLFHKLTVVFGGIFLVLGGGFAIWQGLVYQNAQKVGLENGLAYTLEQSQAVIDYVDAEMLAQKEMTERVAEQLSTSALDQASVYKLLKAGIERKSNLYGLVIAFAPNLVPGQERFAPYYRLTDSGQREFVQVETLYDYADASLPTTRWYSQAAQTERGVWLGQFGKASNDWLVEYTMPFYRDGKFAGVVGAVHSVNFTFHQFLQHVPIGQEGYVVLFDETGKIINHPNADFNGLSIIEAAEMLNDPILKTAGERILTEERLTVERQAANGFRTWTVFETLPTSSWKMAIVMRQDVKAPRNIEKIRMLTHVGLGTLLAILGAALLIFRPVTATAGRLWGFSLTLGFSTLFGIVWMWGLVYSNPLENGSRLALSNDQEIAAALTPIEESDLAKTRGKPLRIPTGVVLETLTITNHTASLSGYLWQNFPLEMDETEIQPPQFTNEIAAADWRETYRFVRNGYRVVGWAFSVELDESFDVSRYPLDEITVKMKIEPPNLAQNVIFVPDLDSYDFIAPSNKPGLAQAVKLPGWNLRTAYFTYEKAVYNADFGGAVNVFKNENPILLYNVHATRSLFSPLIAYCIVIFVILVQIFGIVMIKIDNPLEVLSVGAALFLVNAISHNALRNELAASRTIYLEYFFILLYVTILASSINGILRATKPEFKLLLDQNNLLAKLLFWPLYLGVGLVFTLIVFYP